MTTWGIAMVKNEQDIIGLTMNWMATQVDNVLIADNISTDGTYGILLRGSYINPNVTIVEDDEVGYFQSSKMNALAARAKEMDSDLEWIVPWDADELWYSQDGSIKESLEGTDKNIVECPVWHMVSTGEVINPVLDITMRRPEPEQFPVVAYRYHEDASIHMGNHGVDHPEPTVERGIMEVRHYQYRTLEQFKNKVRVGKAAFDATQYGPEIGAHWRRYGSMSDEAIEAEWNTMVNEPNLVLDPYFK